jgi:tetratricopeptide (TPR) repeat protein
MRHTTSIHSWRLRAGVLGSAVLAVLVLGVLAPAHAADPKYRNDIRNARGYLLRGSSDQALRVYEEILAAHPGDEQATTGKAEVLILLGRLDEADAWIEQALKTVEPKVNLYRKRVDLRRSQGRSEDAFSDAIHVLLENDGLAPWVLQEARVLLSEGLSPAAASRRAEEAQKKNPGNPSLAVLTAVTVALDQRQDEALALMLAFDNQKHRQGQAVLSYAEEILALGDREHALSALLTAADAAEKSSRRTTILFKVSDLLEEDHRYHESLLQLDMIAKEREGTSAAGKALIRSADIYQNHLNDPAGALTVYEKLQNDPSVGHNRPEMLLQMGDCYVKLGRFDRAATVYHSVIPEAIDPEHAERAAFREAEVAFFRGDADSALSLYQTMAEAYPRSLITDDAAGRYILLNSYQSLGGGQAMSLMGRMEWARSIGDSATVDSTAGLLIQWYPESEIAAEAWLALADLAEIAGQHDLALARLEHVVTDHAGDRRAPIALRAQGNILFRELNRSQEALEKYERILTDYPESVVAGEVRRLVEGIRRGQKS